MRQTGLLLGRDSSKLREEGLKLIFESDLLVFVCFLVCLFD